MGKRKVTILDPAITGVAETAFFIESEGLPKTAKKFVDEAFLFFESLSDERLEHKPCVYETWKKLNYRCISYKKKYMVVYLSLKSEIIICEFVSAKLIHW